MRCDTRMTEDSHSKCPIISSDKVEEEETGALQSGLHRFVISDR